MDIEKCKQCMYYCKNLLTEKHICTRDYIEDGYLNIDLKKCRDIVNCTFFRKKRPIHQKWGHYEIPEHLNCGYDMNINFGDDKMRNSDFETRLCSYDELKSHVISSVDIKCEDFNTFKQIVETIMPILEKEDIKEC